MTVNDASFFSRPFNTCDKLKPCTSWTGCYRTSILCRAVRLTTTQLVPQTDSRTLDGSSVTRRHSAAWSLLCKFNSSLYRTERLSPLPSDAAGIMCLLPACRHTAVVCLMLWKLILVGDVGIDMARATRTRRAWLSCQRCHRFLTADRTWRGENGHGFLLNVTTRIKVKTEGMHQPRLTAMT